MQRRHQIFLIASVRPAGDPMEPPKYRCIGGFHHHRSFGLLPLSAMHRFITHIKRPEQAEIVRAEIDAIQGAFQGWDYTTLPRLPCPYTTFLLGSNWSVDLQTPEGAYASGTYFNSAILRAGSLSGGRENTAGISVIDVTDPLSPSYCFVSVRTLQPEAAVEAPLWVPLSAKEYARAYYPEYPPVSKPASQETKQEAKRRLTEENVQATIALLGDVKVIGLETLAEVWPTEYSQSLSETQRSKVGMTADKLESAIESVVPSFADMSLTPAVTHALASGDITDIEAMFWMPGKLSATKAALRGRSPFPDSGILLLTKVIEKELEADGTKLDLSGFSLSLSQIGTVVTAAKGIEVLNLSYIPHLHVDTIRLVLRAHPQLKRLVLLGCLEIELQDIQKLLDEDCYFNQLDALIHPALLRELNDMYDRKPYPNAFSYIGLHEHRLKLCSLPLFTPPRVIQALIDFLEPLTQTVPHNTAMLQSSLPMQAAFSSVRAPGQKWDERSTVIIPQLSLAACRGLGWAFVHYTNESSHYAFIRKTFPAVPNDPTIPVSTPEWKIYDLASFVKQVTQDGRPCPTDEAINKLQDILDTLGTRPYSSDKEIEAFMKGVDKAVVYM